MKYIYKSIVFGLVFLVSVAMHGGGSPVVASSSTSDITDVQAFSKGGGTLITWRIEEGRSVIGYYVYRSKGSSFIKVNTAIVPGGNISAIARESREFSFYDPKGTIGDTYKIEVIEIGRIPYFSKSTQSLYSADLQEPASAEAYHGRSENISVKNYPSDFENESSLQNIDTQRWVASQPGAKISVSSEGLTRVTRAQLANAGFDVNAPESNWQLYLDGIEHAIKIGPNGSYIEFYGKGVDKLETDKNVYFLVVGPGNGKRINPVHVRRIGSAVTTFYFESTYTRKNRFLYASTLLNGDEGNYFGELIGSSGQFIPFDLKGKAQEPLIVQMTLDIQGWTQMPHSIKVAVNGVEFEPMAGAYRDRTVKTYELPSSVFQENGNILELRSLLGSSDFSLLGSISIKYKRHYAVSGGKLHFPSEHYRRTLITGVTDPQIRFFDISSPNEPSEVSNAEITPDPVSGYRAILPAARGRKFYSVEPSSILAPDSVVTNIPSTLSLTTNAADFLIITNPAWRNEALVWANYRAQQGMQTMVVDTSDVFDEFDYGRVSSSSIKSFLEYTYNAWATRPSYVLLLGDSTYDPRNYEGLGEFNFVPVKLVDTLYEETGSDDTLTDFNNDGLAEIPIGRIPARVPVDVTNALQKVMTFENTVANAQARGALCASDIPQGFDFRALCDRLHNELPASIPLSQVNRADADAKNVLLGEINTGKYIVNYSGHGSTGVWAHTSFFGSTDVPALTNQTDLSLFTMLTCLNGYFIRPIDDSLSERLLRSTAGGGVAVWSSSGSTTPDVQEIMATRFFNRIGAGSMNRLGNLINDAKSTIAGGRDVRLSWVLLGDPATIVKPAAPTAKSKAGF